MTIDGGNSNEDRPWRIDGWVKCPACGEWLDAAVAFGNTPAPPDDEDDFGVKEGTVGECESCGRQITIRLVAT